MMLACCRIRRPVRLQLMLMFGLGAVAMFIVKQIHDSTELDNADLQYYRSHGAVYSIKHNKNANISEMVHYDKSVPLIWVGGVPRSGTTLARAMLDAHAQIRCGEETRVIPRILGMHAQMLKSDLEATRLREAKITEDVLNDALGAYILSVIARHGEPAPRLCNKDPFTLRSMARIRQIFPNSKFVLMIRDGRAVVHSIITRKVTIKGFNSQSYRGALQDWNRAIETMYTQCEAVGSSQCLPVYYEQLVLHPEAQMRRLLKFLDIPWDPMVLHHEKTIGQAGGVSLSKKELSTDQVDKPVNTAALSKWVGHIPSDVQNDMDMLAPMLRRLGYDPSANPPDYGKPDPGVMKQAEELDLTERLEKARLH